MGLITGLLTLPLAPVRGTMWIASLIQAEAENQLDDEPAVLSQLAELDRAREQGLISEEESEEVETALLERLLTIRGFGGQETNGQFS
jgi:gas vesicle protein GvpG